MENLSKSTKGNNANTLLATVPSSLHFVVINIGAFSALGVTDRSVVTLKLTDEQRNELATKINSSQQFFDVMMSYE